MLTRILAAALLSATFVNADELRVGAAAEVITPAAGTPMSGYALRAVKDVADDLHAKAIVIERDGVKVALVACDLIGMPRDISDEARRLIAKSPGIPANHVMISATHTHTGPLLYAKPATDTATAEAAKRVEAYLQALPQHIATAVKKADAKLAPARAFAGKGSEPRLNFNRRYFMKTGPVGWNPGKNNPNVDRPAGPVDSDVPVVYFETADEGKTPIATHVSFAMHPDTLHGERISADFPGQLSMLLAKIKGPDMLTLFATGACGDVNHVNVFFRGNQIGARETAKIGMVLAGEVLKTYARMQGIADAPIRAKSEIVQLPLPQFSESEIEAARAELKKPDPPKWTLVRLQAAKVLDLEHRKGKPLDAEVQVIAISDDVAFVAIPGELFAELGLAIKARSPFKHTILVTIANGSLGYIPTKAAFVEGNYEPTASRMAPGGGEVLVDTAVRLLSDLRPTSADQN